MKNKNISELIMLMESLDFATEENYKLGERVAINITPTLADVESVEKELKTKLPQSYIDFNIKSPWYWFESACNYIVNPINHSKNFVYPTICEINKIVREQKFYKYLNEDEDICYHAEKIPDFLIVFDSSKSIDGDYLCFDTRFPKEFPVVYWSIGAVLHNKFSTESINMTNISSLNNPYFLYPNFSSYMYYKIKESIERQSYWNKGLRGRYPFR